MRIPYRKLKEGDYLPPWYYGLAYYPAMTYEAVFYPIPLNYFVRWARNVVLFWNRLRYGRPLRMMSELQYREIVRAEYDRGEKAGAIIGFKDGVVYTWKIINDDLDRRRALRHAEITQLHESEAER